MDSYFYFNSPNVNIIKIEKQKTVVVVVGF